MSIFNNRDHRVEALRKVSLFADLPTRDLLLLDRHVTPTTVPAGTALAREGMAPQQLVLIVEGTASVHVGERMVATLGPGDSIGELSLLDRGQQTATVITDDECALLAVSAREFRSMLEESPGFVLQLLEATARRLRRADELVGSL